MKRTTDYYSAENAVYKDNFKLRYQIGEEVRTKTALDLWLMERYALFQDGKTGINAFEIQHIEWPTYTLDLKEIKVEYPRFNGLLNNRPHLSHYSTGVQVIAWGKTKKNT